MDTYEVKSTNRSKVYVDVNTSMVIYAKLKELAVTQRLFSSQPLSSNSY